MITLGEQILVLLKEKGPLTAEEIAEYLRKDLNEVLEELKNLENDRLVRRVRKGLIIKKDAYELTPTGLEEANKAYEKLKLYAEELKGMLKATAHTADVQEVIHQYLGILPLLILLDLVPYELLSYIALEQAMLGISETPDVVEDIDEGETEVGDAGDFDVDADYF